MPSKEDLKAPFRAEVKHILICDDHPAIRKGTKAILTAEFSGAEFGEASNAAEALKKINGKTSELIFELKKGNSLKNVFIAYDPTTYIVQSIMVNYAAPIKQGDYNVTGSEMKYKNFVINPPFGKQTFSEKTYITFIKNEPVLNKTYSGYSLVNKLTKNKS